MRTSRGGALGGIGFVERSRLGFQALALPEELGKVGPSSVPPAPGPALGSTLAELRTAIKTPARPSSALVRTSS